MSKEMSIKTQNIVVPILSGLCWLASGLSEFGDGTIFRLISIIAMSIAIVTSLLVIIKATRNHIQKGDEMSELHMHQSVYSSYAILLVVVMFLSTAILMVKAVLGVDLIENWYAVTKIFVALMMLLPGIFFAISERNVDQCQD